MIESYWCDVYWYRILKPHLQCPQRITKCLSLYPRCILCNLRGSVAIEEMRRRFGWSKRETARHLSLSWGTYQKISDFTRSGRDSKLQSRLDTLMDKIEARPKVYIREEAMEELTASPLDWFNRHIGRFPWQEEGLWPDPVWPERGWLHSRPCNHTGTSLAVRNHTYTTALHANKGAL